mgnify:CR=1 FL=1
MTEGEVREYLHSIKILTDKRDKKLEQIEELRSVATNCVARMDKDPVVARFISGRHYFHQFRLALCL